MLNKIELEKFKSITGFNLGQVEKDYLQHLFLLFLSRSIKDEIIFKGGTALQKIYGLNRFSEDLDFTLNKETDLDKIIEKICENISNFGFETEHKLIKSKTSKNYRLKIEGPLFDGTEKTIASLKIEISLRTDLILESELKEIIPIYTDLQPYSILVMDIREILAEKIRTTLQREKARDIYDLWFLLKKGVKIDKKLVGKKCNLLKIKFNRNVFFKRVSEIKKGWKNELLGYVSFVPDFNKVIKEIKEHF